MIFLTSVVRAGLLLRRLRMRIRRLVAGAPARATDVEEQDESRGKSGY